MAVVAVVVLTTSTVVSIWQWRGFERGVQNRFSQTSHDTLTAFASLARTPLVRGDRESLGAMATLVLGTRAVFVQIVVGENEILALKHGELDLALEPMPWMRFDSGSVATIESDPRVLDLALPIESTDRDTGIVGYTRIAFDRSPSLKLLATGRAMLIGGNVTLGVILLATLAWLIRRQQRATRQAEAPRMGTTSSEETVLAAGPLRINASTKQVWFEGREVKLTPKQLALLSHLAQCCNRVYSDRELIAAVWPSSAYATSADVKQCVYTLRKRLAEVCDSPSELIANVQGYGYRLSIPEPEDDLTAS